MTRLEAGVTFAGERARGSGVTATGDPTPTLVAGRSYERGRGWVVEVRKCMSRLVVTYTFI